MKSRKLTVQETAHENGLRRSAKYPFVMLHGTGFRQYKLFNYWGRIPKALIGEGAEIFYAKSDAWGSIEHNAGSVKRSVLEVLDITGAEKVNIIAHSKGGLEARYMISKLGMADCVASLTTISAPHHGSKAMDLVNKCPAFIINFISNFVNAYYWFLGDVHPDFQKVLKQITSENCAEFNKEVLNEQTVFYQSYASKMKNSFSDVMLFFTHFVLKRFEGDNDGVVGVDSARWGVFRGVISCGGTRGVSHGDIVDLRRKNISGFDIRKVYVDIVRGLAAMGY